MIFEKGQWVEYIGPDNPNFYIPTFPEVPMSKGLRKGCIFKIQGYRNGDYTYCIGLDKDGQQKEIGINSSLIRPSSNPLVRKEVPPPEIKQKPRRQFRIPFTIPLGISFASLVYFNTHPGVSPMQISNDPIIQKTIVYLTAGSGGLLFSTLTWMFITNIAKGFAKWGDRIRSIRQETDKQNNENTNEYYRRDEETEKTKSEERIANQKLEIERKESALRMLLVQNKHDNDMKEAAARRETERMNAMIEAAVSAYKPDHSPVIAGPLAMSVALNREWTPQVGDIVMVNSRISPGTSSRINERIPKKGDVGSITKLGIHPDKTVQLEYGNWFNTNELDFVGRRDT